jgi:peptidoglycan/LPS O-acetylase OafA/YrhL
MANLKSNLEFVHGGGWVRKYRNVRPKTAGFAVLAVVCLLVALGIPTLVSVGDWLRLGLFLPVLGFLALAIHSFRSEAPRKIAERTANPNCDLRKLY